MEDELFLALGLEDILRKRDDRDKLLRLYFSELGPATATNDVDHKHSMVLSTLAIMRTRWPDLNRPECRRLLLTQFPGWGRSVIDEATDIALRIFMMIDSRDDSSTGYPRCWNEFESIKNVVHDRFPRTAKDEYLEISRFPRQFRAVDLEKISSIEIQWTTYLDEHLVFNDDNRTLKIFNNKAWLSAIVKRETADKESSEERTWDCSSSFEVGLPRGLAQETIDTLNVLFPPWHDKTVRFLKDQDQDFHLIPPVPRDLPKLRNFTFWRERLTDVIIEFEAPRKWKDVWRDRRYPVSFWTFWIGISIFLMTLAFGIVASLLAGFGLKAAVEQIKAQLNG